MKIKSILMASLIALVPCNASAQGSAWLTKVGTIRNVALSYSNNFAFRIFFANVGSEPFASCNNQFAYINTSDDNYQAKASALLSAYAQQRTVWVSYIVDGSGYCQITDFTI